MSQIYYEQAFMERLRAVCPDGGISDLPSLPERAAHGILREILETGCLSGNHANIEIAHKALSRVPPEWLLVHLPKVVPECLFKEPEWQEWEFRRLAEMLGNHFPDSLKWLTGYAKGLDNPEVDDAIADFSDK